MKNQKKEKLQMVKYFIPIIISVFLFSIGCNSGSSESAGAESVAALKNSDSDKLKESFQYVHHPGMPEKGKILMVASSPLVSKQTGWPIGFWSAELTHPLHVFQEAGYEVDLVSTDGGKLEIDAYSDPEHESKYSVNDVITRGYMELDWFNQMLDDTQKLTVANAKDYDAIFLVGGQAPVYTFRGNQDLEKLFAAFYEAGKPSAAVCHGTAFLLEAKTSNGDLIIKNKTWTGFTIEEEKIVDKSVGMQMQPYWIEEEAKKIAQTNFKTSTAFSSHAIADGNLITGQQQYSGTAAAELVIDQLNENGK